MPCNVLFLLTLTSRCTFKYKVQIPSLSCDCHSQSNQGVKLRGHRHKPIRN